MPIQSVGDYRAAVVKGVTGEVVGYGSFVEREYVLPATLSTGALYGKAKNG